MHLFDFLCIACIMQFFTVAHNCHGKRINLEAKRKNLTVKREKSHGKNKNFTAKRKASRQKNKTKTKTKTKKAHSKTSSMPKGHFNSYFVCREVEVFLFAGSLFSFCREINSFAVTLVGHHGMVVGFP